MRGEPSSFADDGRILFFAKLGVGLAWRPDHGGVTMRRSSQQDEQPQLWVIRGNPDAASSR
jgi:hypothetical protein